MQILNGEPSCNVDLFCDRVSMKKSFKQISRSIRKIDKKCLIFKTFYSIRFPTYDDMKTTDAIIRAVGAFPSEQDEIEIFACNPEERRLLRSGSSSLTVIGRLVCNCRHDRIGLKAGMYPPKTDGENIEFDVSGARREVSTAG